MKTLALSWIGTRTDSFAESVAFFKDVLGLRIGNQRSGFVRFDLPDGSSIEVFRAGAADDYAYFTTGPVVGFQVEDFESALEDLRTAGCDLLGATGGKIGEYRWQHFRGPDGGTYEVVDSPLRHSDDSAIGRARVTGFGWAGIRTSHYDAMRKFVLNTLGLRIVEEETGLVVFEMPNGDVLELFRPGGPSDHPHLTTGPMPGLIVEDLELGKSKLRAAQVEILAWRRSGLAGWTHFRAPDGFVYELKRSADARPRH
jgi:catechol 2,3-dioxygenase-like lactoylglutathione lyase family enzyme